MEQWAADTAAPGEQSGVKKLHFLLVICIAKVHLNVNNFKGDFLNIQMFLDLQIPDLQILSKPYINGNIIYSAFR